MFNNVLYLTCLLHRWQMGLVVGVLTLNYSKRTPIEAGQIYYAPPEHWSYKR